MSHEFKPVGSEIADPDVAARRDAEYGIARPLGQAKLIGRIVNQLSVSRIYCAPNEIERSDRAASSNEHWSHEFAIHMELYNGKPYGTTRLSVFHERFSAIPGRHREEYMASFLHHDMAGRPIGDVTYQLLRRQDGEYDFRTAAEPEDSGQGSPLAAGPDMVDGSLYDLQQFNRELQRVINGIEPPGPGQAAV